MRVLIVTPDITKKAGVSNYYRILRKHFPENVVYFTACRRAKESPVKAVVRILKDYWSFFRKIGSYELVHLNPSFDLKSVYRDMFFCFITLLKRRKLVVSFHGWKTSFERKLNPFGSFLFRNSFCKADAVIVLQSHGCEYLTEAGFSRSCYLLPTAVPDDVFAINGSKSRSTDQCLDKHILFLSRIEKSKGIFDALQVFRLIQKEIPEVFLTVAGDGSQLEAVRSMVDSEHIGGVTFTGWLEQEEKFRAYLEADLYLFTSHSEGFPTTVVEAMACGLPVVTTSVGGLRDIFEQGEMGYMHRVGDQKGLAKSAVKLLSDYQFWNRISDHNRRYAFVNFRSSALCERILGIYDELEKQ